MNNFPNKIKKEVVRSIIHGELMLEEAMSKYNIQAKATIIRWLKEARSKTADNEEKT